MFITIRLEKTSAKIKTGMRRLRISAISYLNTAPLMWDFVHDNAGHDFDISYTLPSACARSLEAGAAELAAMKPSARLVNTSRGPIVEEAALIEALRERRIAGAAIDVFDVEPLPPDHPYRSLENVLATPHIGYVSRELYRTFYGDTVKNIAAWLDRR